MKVKKFINQEINGFLILDTYPKTTANGKKTRKVLLRCSDCGREFERAASCDFNSVKCKCKVKYLQPKQDRSRFIEWEGVQYRQAEFCRLHNISEGTLTYRLRNGATIEEAVSETIKKICPVCEKRI